MTEIFPLVHALFDARDAKGFETYGRRCEANDGRNTLVDMIEEGADNLVYSIKKLVEEVGAEEATRLLSVAKPKVEKALELHLTEGQRKTLRGDQPAKRRWWHCDRCDTP